MINDFQNHIFNYVAASYYLLDIKRCKSET